MQKIHYVIVRITSQQELSSQGLDVSQWKTLSTNSAKHKSVFENIISHSMAGCYMLGEENRHWIAFMLWEGSAGEAVSMSVCLCVGSGMKGCGWACTDRRTGRPVASGNQKPWFTTRRWSDTHSSVWELDRRCWSARARTSTPTHTRMLTSREALMFGATFVLGISEVEKGWEKGEGIHRGKSRLWNWTQHYRRDRRGFSKEKEGHTHAKYTQAHQAGTHLLDISSYVALYE